MNGSSLELAEAQQTTRAELEELRARLQTSLGALEIRLRELRDWRSWVRRHPWPFVLGVCAAGALLGWRLRGRAGVTAR